MSLTDKIQTVKDQLYDDETIAAYGTLKEIEQSATPEELAELENVLEIVELRKEIVQVDKLLKMFGTMDDWINVYEGEDIATFYKPDGN